MEREIFFSNCFNHKGPFNQLLAQMVACFTRMSISLSSLLIKLEEPKDL